MKGLFKLPVLVSLTVLIGAACAAQGPLVSKATPRGTPTSSSQSPSPLALPSQFPSQSPPQSASASPSPSQQASPTSAYAGSGSWVSRGEMSTPRADFAAVAFSSGEVLLIGGETSTTTDTATVDLFQPPSDTFNPNPPPPMKRPRNGHSATLLPNGKVLVAGGSSTPNGPALASAELYDPTTKTWSDAAPMAEPRTHHVAVLMNNGRVFVAGGDGGGGGSDPQTNEIYDPGTNTWTSAQTFFGDRPNGPAVSMMQDGRVMIFGGVWRVEPGNNLELYDPRTGLVNPTGSGMALTTTSWSTAATLSSGNVLIVGGQQTYQPGGALNTTELYDPLKDVQGAPVGTPWVAGPVMNVGHCRHTMTVLQNGLILVAGGRCGSSESINVAELYDQTANTWHMAASMNDARGFHVAVLMRDGRVLVAGGLLPGGTITAKAEVYLPA